MRAKPTDLGYKKDIGRCRSCQQTVLWGYRFGKKHPYDVVFDSEGEPRKTTSHFDTCPSAAAWRPKSRGLRLLGDLNTAAIHKWCETCQIPDAHPPIDVKTVVLFEEVPEKHAKPIAWQLVEQGGPFAGWHPDDLIPHFRTIAVRDMKVVAVLLTPAVFNRIHYHLHGFTMSVFSDMAERKPVSVAGYRLEPTVVLSGK